MSDQTPPAATTPPPTPPPQGGYYGTPLQPGMAGPLFLEPPNSGMAIASFVVSLASFVVFPVIGHIIGLVLGYIARNEIRNSGGRVRGDGFATAGIILGYVGLGLFVVGIILILVIVGVLATNVHNVSVPTTTSY